MISASLSVHTQQKGDKGDNSVRLDISNEMDTVPTDSTGKITAARTVETVVRLYDGAEEVNISAASLTITGAPGSAIATQSSAASGKGVKLSWAFKAAQAMAGVYNISIAYTYKGTPYSAVFTVTASKGLTVYQLKPSLTSIPFQRDASGALTPASREVGLSIVKIVGETSEVYSTASEAGVKVRYSTQGMPASVSDGTEWASGRITVSNTATNLYIAMFNSSNVMIDRETVPVVKDGAKGEKGMDAVSATVSPSAISVPLNGFGKPKAQVSQTVSFALRVGTDTVGGDYSFSHNAISNVSVTSGSGGKTATVTVGTGALEANLRGGLVFTVSGTYNGVGVSATCTLSFVTAYQGESGHVGRWYEYAGEYGKDLASSLSNTDDHGWYAKRGNNFFMLIADSGTSVATSTIPTTATSNTNWEYMGGDRKYYIGEAFFGKYAHFGSFIINEDWMISQQGVLTLMKNTEISRSSWSYAQFTAKSSGNRKVTFENHSSSSVSLTLYANNASTTTSVTIEGKSSKSITLSVEANKTYDFRRTSGVTVILSASMEPSMEYTLFDPDYPTGMGYLKFAPNFAVDGLTGKTYQRSAYIRGNIYNPLLRITSSNYLEYGYVSSGNYYIDLLSTDYSIQLEGLPDTYKERLRLPDPTEEQEGVEVTVLNVSGGRLTFLGTNIVSDIGENDYTAANLWLENAQFVRLKAIRHYNQLQERDCGCYIIIGGGNVKRTGSYLPTQYR